MTKEDNQRYLAALEASALDVGDAMTRAASMLECDEAWTFNFPDIIALAGVLLEHDRAVLASRGIPV